MLTSVLAHAGRPTAPHDIWGAWNLDPLLLLGLVLPVWVLRRGRPHGGRATYFVAGVAAIGVAVISPLDAASGALASAHMVQHLLLVLVAAPLLAMSAPIGALMRGSPALLRRAGGRWRRQLKLDRNHLRFLREPVTVFVLHVAALWFWHAAGPYDAALRSHPLHVVEHASFLVTGILFWRLILGSRAAGRVSNGLGVLLVFGMALQSVILAMLLTFSRAPWYSGYADTTRLWHLEPLADQQLAGVIMWVPAGVVYVGVALILFVAWLNGTDGAPVTTTRPLAPMPATSERTNSG